MARLFEGTPLDRPPRCERCGELESQCPCPPPLHRVDPSKQTARLAIEKRAKGKLMTVVRGLSSADNNLPTLLATLKSACGAGGTLDGDDLLIQGKQLDRVRETLRQMGFKVRG